MLTICLNNVMVVICKFTKKNLVGHKIKLVGHVPQCAPPWLRHWCMRMCSILKYCSLEVASKQLHNIPSAM